MTSPTLKELITSFKSRMPYSHVAYLPPEILSAQIGIFSDRDVERAALLDYLIFLSRRGAVLLPGEVDQALTDCRNTYRSTTRRDVNWRGDSSSRDPPLHGR